MLSHMVNWPCQRDHLEREESQMDRSLSLIDIVTMRFSPDERLTCGQKTKPLTQHYTHAQPRRACVVTLLKPRSTLGGSPASAGNPRYSCATSAPYTRLAFLMEKVADREDGSKVRPLYSNVV